MVLINEEEKTFLSGRRPPKFDEDNLDHPVMVDWYKEQARRCILGYEHKGHRITGEHYFMLNFMPIKRFILDVKGNPTKKFEIEYPLWTQADDKLFKQIEEAKKSNLDFMLMTPRGWGKTYCSLALILRDYVFIRGSHCIVAGASEKLVSPTFNQKLIPSLNELENNHLFLKQKRNVDTPIKIQSGEIVDTGKVKSTRGRNCILEKIIFNTEGATAGRRANITLFEEIGEFTNNPSLKDCINNHRGVNNVGGVKTGFTMYIGTGGSVASTQARDIYYNAEAYELYVPDDCDRTVYEKGHGVFFPVYSKYGGYYEKTGYPEEEKAKDAIISMRAKKEDDVEAYTKFVQQFPLTVEEVFMTNTRKIFSSSKLSKQTTDLITGIINPSIKRGYLESYKNNNKLEIVFKENKEGNLYIFEHPVWVSQVMGGLSTNESKIIDKLYISGIDSVDQDKKDSTAKKGDLSKIACLVKKRVDPTSPLNATNSSYVAMYWGRSEDSRDDYEQILLLHIYYNALGLLEHTRIRIRDYFVEKNATKYLAREPSHLSNTIKGYNHISHKIGIRITTDIIDAYIDYIKEYIQDYYDRIYFIDILRQLGDYSNEKKKKFDLVAAMGMCELLDREMRDVQPNNSKNKNKIKQMSWYTDSFGRKVFGHKPEYNEY